MLYCKSFMNAQRLQSLTSTTHQSSHNCNKARQKLTTCGAWELKFVKLVPARVAMCSPVVQGSTRRKISYQGLCCLATPLVVNVSSTQIAGWVRRSRGFERLD